MGYGEYLCKVIYRTLTVLAFIYWLARGLPENFNAAAWPLHAGWMILLLALAAGWWEGIRRITLARLLCVAGGVALGTAGYARVKMETRRITAEIHGLRGWRLGSWKERLAIEHDFTAAWGGHAARSQALLRRVQERERGWGAAMNRLWLLTGSKPGVAGLDSEVPNSGDLLLLRERLERERRLAARAEQERRILLDEAGSGSCRLALEAPVPAR